MQPRREERFPKVTGNPRAARLQIGKKTPDTCGAAREILGPARFQNARAGARKNQTDTKPVRAVDGGRSSAAAAHVEGEAAPAAAGAAQREDADSENPCEFKFAGPEAWHVSRQPSEWQQKSLPAHEE